MSLNLQPLVEFCRSLPHTVEDVKWGKDLVFSIRGGKMFCVFGMAEEEGAGAYTGMSFKVDDHRFLEMTDRPQFIPAPYMARARWVLLVETKDVTVKELKDLVRRSHELYFEKLPKKTQQSLRGEA